jgi:hypothetical protein
VARHCSRDFGSNWDWDGCHGCRSCRCGSCRYRPRSHRGWGWWRSNGFERDIGSLLSHRSRGRRRCWRRRLFCRCSRSGLGRCTAHEDIGHLRSDQAIPDCEIVDLSFRFRLCRTGGFHEDFDRSSVIAFCKEATNYGQLIGWQRSWHETISAKCVSRRNPVLHRKPE